MQRNLKVVVVLMLLATSSLLVMCGQKEAGTTGDSQTAAAPMDHAKMVKRGEYLVNSGGCDDCHSPKIMTTMGPAVDTTRRFSGQPENEVVPEFPNCLSPTGWMAATNASMTAWSGPWGISFAANITPDQATGIGAWTEDSFVETMRTGKHLGMGREILPPMPWMYLAKLTDEDLKSVFAYLQTIKPVVNQVPQPIPPASAPMGDASAH